MKKSLLVSLLLTGIAAAGPVPDSWYPFTPTNEPGPSEIGMEDWVSERAGTDGRIEIRGEKLFSDGKEIKLWGLNNTYGNCAPDKAMAEKRAALYRKFGMNTIRFHKYADGFGWAGIQSEESFADFDPEGLDRMDYYASVLAENGIYIKLSPTFGVKFGPKDAENIPYADEFGEMKRKRVKSGHGAIFLSTELQDLQIEQTIKLLEHRNPYTGMSYAEDPAVFCVEMFNEDAVLWSGTNRQLQGSPTLRKRSAENFSTWLKEKYGSEEAWKEAWGVEAIIAGEHFNAHLKNLAGDELSRPGQLPAESLEAGTVVPWGQQWHYGKVAEGDESMAPLQRRLLDTMKFLIEEQQAFYNRFAKAIRATGFDGAILASNWVAGSGFSHFYNLWADAQFDIVDRHNYFGGAPRGSKDGSFNNASMLAAPGSELLSSGMQQVQGKPFMLSEWIHVQPTEWLAESAPIIGTYGMGLNGWDVSYIFQNTDDGGFSDRLYQHDWDATVPQVLASFATLSRQVRRLDVREAPDPALLRVHVPSFEEGKRSVNDKTIEQFDYKSYTSDEIPYQALAVTRVAVDFTEEFRETTPFDVEEHIDEGDYVSRTSQLRWAPAPEGKKQAGHFTINTERTKAFVGFASGDQTFQLGELAITPAKGYAVIMVTAKERKANSLAESNEWIITAMARGRNTGSQIDGNKLVENGEGPIRLEPVEAEITGKITGTLSILDHDGRKQGRGRPVDGSITIDGKEDRTPFYLFSRNQEGPAKTDDE